MTTVDKIIALVGESHRKAIQEIMDGVTHGEELVEGIFVAKLLCYEDYEGTLTNDQLSEVALFWSDSVVEDPALDIAEWLGFIPDTKPTNPTEDPNAEFSTNMLMKYLGQHIWVGGRVNIFPDTEDEESHMLVLEIDPENQQVVVVHDFGGERLRVHAKDVRVTKIPQTARAKITNTDWIAPLTLHCVDDRQPKEYALGDYAWMLSQYGPHFTKDRAISVLREAWRRLPHTTFAILNGYDNEVMTTEELYDEP
jgi:hypothetical protein